MWTWAVASIREGDDDLNRQVFTVVQLALIIYGCER